MLGEINKNPTRRDLRLFGFSLIIGFALLGTIFWVRAAWASGQWGWSGLGLQGVALGFWIVGGGAGLISVASETIGKIIYRVWTTVAMAIGMVMIPVGLTLVFVLLLPWFTFIRLSDPLRKKLGAQATYWEPHRVHEPTVERTRRPF